MNARARVCACACVWRAEDNLHSGGKKEEEEEQDPKTRFPIPLSSLCPQWSKDLPLGSAFFCTLMHVEGRGPHQVSLSVTPHVIFLKQSLTELKLINLVRLASGP